MIGRIFEGCMYESESCALSKSFEYEMEQDTANVRISFRTIVLTILIVSLRKCVKCIAYVISLMILFISLLLSRMLQGHF
jgi:hypothetical protein